MDYVHSGCGTHDARDLYAAGNRARLVRFDKETGKQKEYQVRLNDLLKRGDTKANVMLAPGDVIIIPESMF